MKKFGIDVPGKIEKTKWGYVWRPFYPDEDVEIFIKVSRKKGKYSAKPDKAVKTGALATPRYIYPQGYDTEEEAVRAVVSDYKINTDSFRDRRKVEVVDWS